MTDNKRHTRTFEYQVTDALAIAHALMIGSNTALLCGRKGAQERLKQYTAMFMAEVPEAAKIFDGDVWCEIGIALPTATGYSAGLIDTRYDFHTKTMVGRVMVSITIGTRMLQWSTWDWTLTEAAVVAVDAVLAELAPLGCTNELKHKP